MIIIYPIKSKHKLNKASKFNNKKCKKLENLTLHLNKSLGKDKTITYLIIHKKYKKFSQIW